MPKNTIGDVPFPPVTVIDKDNPIEEADIAKFRKTDGLSLCIRYQGGHQSRGGYFFHFSRKPSSGVVTLFDFEGRPVTEMSEPELVRFINHCTGRQFDEWSFGLAQSELNFLKDD